MNQDVSTVFIVDDNQQARDSVALLVRSMGVASEGFATAAEFLDSYEPQRAGCLVTDQRMPGMTGMELQKALLEQGVTLPIIIITAYAHVSLAVTAVRRGAVTVIEKPYEDEDLWNAIRTALATDATSRREQTQLAEVRARFAGLTEKHREVLRLVLAGKPNKVTARELGVSIRTVENRRHEIFTKTGTDSVAELVRLSIAAGEAAPLPSDGDSRS